MQIVIGVTGSIAAYKACELVRCFVKAGDEVRVVMTEAATKFVTPLTFQTLSRNPVGVDPFALPAEWKPEHISLADAADPVDFASFSAFSSKPQARHLVCPSGIYAPQDVQ